MILKKQCLLLLLSITFVALTSEKAINKQEKYDPIKSLRAYLDDLERERLQKKYVGIDFQSGSNRVEINKNEILQPRRFGRGSSENNAKL